MRTRGFFLAAALAALRLAEPDAAAQPRRPAPLAQSLPPDARRDYDAGKLLFEDGDYATALLKFEAAHDRTRDPRLLWNVAVCLKDLRHYALAAATLGRYLAEGGDLLTPGDRRDAQELARAIAPFTVPMTIHVSEPGAQIRIDDAAVGQSPLAGPVSLDMGTRRVRVEKEGYRPFDRELPVGGSAATTIDVTLARQGGHLRLDLPADATAWLDENEVGHGPRLELDLAVGAHAVRVTAPGMRPLVSDVVIADGESRGLDVALDPEAPPSSEVHVAVTCLGQLVPPDALGVYFDDAEESALPMGARIQREAPPQAVAYLAYLVAPGRHRVHVAAQHCDAQDVTVDAPGGGVVVVIGSLPPANRWLDGSPAGSPDRWRLAAGFIESSTRFSAYQNFSPSSLGLGTSSLVGNVNATLVGPMVTAGFQTRWLTALLDARFQVGRQLGTLESSATTLTTGGTVPAGTAVSYNSTLSQWNVGFRSGVRLPLVVAALSTGVGFHLGQYFYGPDAGASRSGVFLSPSYWIALDAQPFCEWGLQAAGSISEDDYSGLPGSVGDLETFSLSASVTYTPNTMCTRLRSGLDGIRAITR